MNSNYLGTYTFESLEAFQAGQPTSYSRRIGDPTVDTLNVMTAFYLQDDIRVRKNLTFSPGLRYEVQSHVRDYNNVSPRFGFTWSPFKSGRTSFRGSAGIFYDWMSQNTLEQVARVDGLHQHQVNIFDPAYPDPGPITAVLPADRYLLDPSLQLPMNIRFSGGVDQQVSKYFRMNLLYQHWRTDGFVEMVTPLEPPPTADERDRITVWLKLPDTEAFNRVARQIETSPYYALPPVKCETAASGIAAFLDAYRDIIWVMRWPFSVACLTTLSLIIANALLYAAARA